MERIELILVVVFTILLPDSVLGTEDRKKIKGHYFKGIKAGMRPVGMELELPLFSENRNVAIL